MILVKKSLGLAVLSLVSLLATGAAFSTIAQAEWTTVNDYAPGNGQFWNLPTASFVEADGTLWESSIIQTIPFAGQQIKIRKRSDSGTWTDSFTPFSYVTGKVSNSAGIVVLADGRVIVSGSGEDANGIKHWISYASTDGGTSFHLIEDYQSNPGHSAEAYASYLDAKGRLTVVGYASDTSDRTHAVVRRLDSHGVMKTLFLDSRSGTSAKGFTISNKKLSYLAGTIDGSLSIGESADDGKTFTESERYNYSGLPATNICWFWGGQNPIVSTQQGTVLATGTCYGTKSEGLAFHAITLKMSYPCKKWQVVDDVPGWSQGTTLAYSRKKKSILAGGRYVNPARQSLAIVRESLDGGKTFHNLGAPYQLPGSASDAHVTTVQFLPKNGGTPLYAAYAWGQYDAHQVTREYPNYSPVGTGTGNGGGSGNGNHDGQGDDEGDDDHDENSCK